jgi:hypothetical protein
VSDCNFHGLRFGAQVHYHLAPERSLDPWIGAGIGYEWLTSSVSSSGSIVPNGAPGPASLSTTVHGFEFVNLQGGLDFKPWERSNFGVGPFVSFSLGEYDSGSIACGGTACNVVPSSRSSDVREKGIHEWLTLGVRGTFVP